MRQSNLYIVIFTAIMTVVVGGVLSLTSQVLAPAQKKSIELDTKSAILSSVMDLEASGLKGNAILETYNNRIQSLVVDINGNEVTTDEKGNPVVAEQVNVANKYKKKPENRLYPVFKYMNEQNPDQVESYILPLYGAGLWDKIWGLVALDNNFEEIVGASFDHRGETPGLGARIATNEIQERYKGKKIFDNSGNLVSVMMVKGEGNRGLSEHQVDGMSGATITCKGLNDMLKNYLGYYQSYIDSVKGNTRTASIN